MIRRNITPNLLAALSDSPVVLLHGARQTGKSTLVQHVAEKAHRARYLTLDDASVLAAAQADPAGFLAGLDGPIALDEVQRVPELFLAIKAAVDRRRRPGQYLLTGSANVMMLPKLSESLAGRLEILTLWPFSQGEIEGREERFVDALFASKLPDVPGPGKGVRDLATRIVSGGYPEARARTAAPRRRAWFDSYLTTILQRDVRDLAHVEALSDMPRLLALLATRIGSLLNVSEVSRGLGVPYTTLSRYMALLQATFLVQPSPPWFANLGKRLVKSPKLFLNDTALAANLLGIDTSEPVLAGPSAGTLTENFVVMELRKQITWSRTRPRLFHFRTLKGQNEVDVVLENAAGKLVGVEVKAGGSVDSGDFRGLRVLADQTGKRFLRGVVLYAGQEIVPFGRNLHALPISALWLA